ncbi:MAG TPA: hypothetical protein DDZ81_11835 [Acetobacteraceae bacterium]|nr:hypothetical protein [Acetobacteraceae bacterium]
MNYLDLYGLAKSPFGAPSDESVFILFGSRRRAFELLADHLVNGSGVVLLVGEEGTGKSETLRSAGAIAAEAGIEVITASRPVGERVSQDVLASALERLSGPPRKAGLVDDVDLLSDDCLGLLVGAVKQGPTDNADNPIVLSCSETGLARPGVSELAGLARNVIRLGPLNPSEAHQYIERSLWIAGGTTRRLITPDALKLLIARSNGIPATINRLMEATFNAGFARGDPAITAKTVAAAVGPIAPRQSHRLPSAPNHAGLAMQIVAIGLLVAGASIFLYKGFSEQPPPSVPIRAATTQPTEKVPIAKAPEPMSPNLMAALIKRGNEALDLGDVAAARLLFQRAAEAGNAAAATALGKTYDPRDPQKAAEWYTRAVNLGDSEAAGLLKRLPTRSKGS